MDVEFALSVDGGRRFTAPVRVNDVAGEANISGEQPPRVVIHAHTWMWSGSRSGTVSRSSELRRRMTTGRHFRPLVRSRRRDRRRAGMGIGVDRRGRIDPRRVVGRSVGGATAAHGSGRGFSVDGRRCASSSHGGTQAGRLPRRVARRGEPVGNARRDECVLLLQDGHRYARQRRVRGVEASVRRRRPRHRGRALGGRRSNVWPPVRASADNWKIDACPDDGPALAVDSRGVLHITWPTLIHDGGRDRMAIFHAASDDGGITFSARERVDQSTAGSASHPRIAAASTAPWRSSGISRTRQTDERGKDRRWSERAVVLNDHTASSYPAVAAIPTGYVVALDRAAMARNRVSSFGGVSGTRR